MNKSNIIRIIIALMTLSTVASVCFNNGNITVLASNKSISIQVAQTQRQFPSYSDPVTNQTAANNYEVNASGNKIHIGSATNEFSPNIYIPAFGNESYIELNLIGGGKVASFTTSTISNGTITAENQYFTLQYSAVPQKQDFNELGGLDMVMTLKRKPSLNVVTFTYNHSRVNAYLQSALTQDEIANGSIQPDYAVNSIAFYGDGNQVNNEYKTGKIGHLYRLKVTDAVSNTTWADWGFGGGQSQITLTVPQVFLDSAVYPVIIAPVADTFGYTSQGVNSMGTSFLREYTATAGSAGTVTKITARVWDAGSSGSAKCGLYNTSENLVGTTDAVTGIPFDASWIDFTSSISISATSYRITILGSANMNIHYDNGGTCRAGAATYPTFPNSTTWEYGTTSRSISIYCTYTPSGGYDISNTPSSKDFGVVNTSSTYWASGTDPAIGTTELIKAPTTQSADGTGWTDPTNAYGSNNQYASATMTSGSTIYPPTANTNGVLPWSNPTYAYGSNNQYATVAPSYGSITSKQPTANSAGSYTQWINPANAYDGGSNQYATVTIAATSETRRPTGDVQDTASSSKSTGSTFYGLVDEDPASDTDYFTMTTNGGGHNVMSSSAFTIPAGSIITNLTIYYRAGNTASNPANIMASILTGTTYRDTTDSGSDPSDSPNYTNYSYAFTVNPATGVAWTYDEINGSDATTAHRLNGFGVASSDCNPDVNVSQVYAVCNYIPGTQYDQVYKTHAISDPGTSSTITKVEIGYEAYSDTASKTVNFYTSANGGSTWSSVHTSSAWATSDPGSYTYIDVTADQTWTWTLLDNTNFQVKIETPVPTTACVRYLDNLIVRVTYDDRRVYDHIYGTYGITGTATITKVEIGYEAYASATGKLDIYDSADGGTNWSSVHTTSNLGTTDSDTLTWIDVTSDQTWTWTLLNDTNLKVKVKTNYVSGTPSYYLDYIAVRVTSNSAIPSTIYGTYGYSISDVITKLEVGVEGYTSAGATKNLAVYTSWDGGTSWSSKHTYSLPTSDPNTVTWVDCTADTAWTGTKINDTNLKIKMTHDAGDQSYEYIDYIPVRITYTKTITDAQCTFTLTNNGASAIDVNAHTDDFTGGVGWNIVNTSPSTDETRVTIYYSGEDPASGLVLTNADQKFYDSLASSGHFHWDIKMETGSSFSDGTQKSSTLTLTAVAES